MKKLIIILISTLILSGCISQVVKDKLSKNAAQLDGYVNLMENGDTTPENNQDLIRAMRIWTWSMNHLVNDEEPPPDVKLILDARSND